MITLDVAPSGYKITDTEFEGEITDDGGDALVTTSFSHGLISGQVLFVQTNIEYYNGYRFILVLSTTTFKITDVFSGDPFPYFSDTPITYQVSVYEHRAMAVHNPIVYELSTDLFPTNSAEEAYVPAVVDSFANENGYTKLTLSGNLSDATALAWIVINEIPYQIINAISDSIVVINHAYNSTDTFPGPVVKYYNNYCINIEVWCGYEPTHKWASIKPYVLAATLRFTPDDSNSIKFSISEIVKSYITTRNKLDLNTLPNNTDFTAGFYIGYYESYDESDGLEITTHIGSTTYEALVDAGLGVNAMMPFKSKDSGNMSEYVRFGGSLSKWLVLQDSMTWIVDKFMDLSFLTIGFVSQGFEVRDNGVAIQEIPNPSNGVIRVPLTFDTAGQHCIQIYSQAIDAEAGYSFLKSAMVNCGDATWSIGPVPAVTLATLEDSGYLVDTFDSIPGIDYPFSYSIDITASAGTPTTKVEIALLDDDCNELGVDSDTHFSGGTITGMLTVSPSTFGTRVGIRITNLTVPNTKAYELTDMDFIGSAAVSAEPVTEEFCITVVEECDSTIVPDDIRLLEDGDYRILE